MNLFLHLKNKLNINKLVYFTILTFTILLAVFFRLKFFLADKPLWLDEAMLADNIVNSGWQQAFHTLKYSQAAPPMFILISKIFSKIIPDIELALRTLPLICSLASVYTFYLLTQKFFTNKYISLLAFIAFSLNYVNIQYCQEFKQYSLDILANTLLLLSYFYIDFSKLKSKKIILISFLYAIAPWFSFTSIFTLGAIFITRFINLKRDYKIIITFLPFAISFIVFYLNQHALNSSNILHEYWINAGGFINKNFSNLFVLFKNASKYYFRENTLYLLSYIAFYIGIGVSILKIKSEKYQLLLFNLLLILIASYITVYPFADRISLHFLPSYILFVFIAINFIKDLCERINLTPMVRKVTFAILYTFICIYLLIININIDTHMIIMQNFFKEDIKSLLIISKQLINKNDVLYIVNEPTYKFYSKQLGYNFNNVIIEDHRTVNKYEYYKELDKLPKGKKYFYILEHYPHLEQRVQDVWQWAKTQDNASIFVINKSFSTLIIFNKK